MSAESAVVAGADGSDHSLQAVGWAAGEAQLLGLPLHIVHAGPAAPEILPLASAVARRAAPDLVVATTGTDTDPATALLDAARGAALLVVGMGGGWDRVLVGSVALDVSGRAPCPVVVVRGGPVPPHGPVLVGIDPIGFDGSVLAVALADARRHGSRVRVLHARYVTHPPRTPGEEQAVDLAVRNRLLALIRPWTARFPEVVVQVDVVHGNPARELLRAAQGCRSVVLGTRGQGPYDRDLFGSTSREVLRRSPVTVLVVAPGAAVPVPDAGVHRADDPHDLSVLY